MWSVCFCEREEEGSIMYSCVMFRALGSSPSFPFTALLTFPAFLLLLLLLTCHPTADIRELSELYKLEQSYFKHRDEGPKSDYFDPLVHGDRNTSR